MDTRGERFHATIDGAQHSARADAGAHLCRLLPERGGSRIEGSFAGFSLHGAVDRHAGVATITLDPSPIKLDVDLPDLAQLGPSRLMQRLEHRLARLEQDLDDSVAGAASAKSEAERGAARLDQPLRTR